jgi:hypothetical protein
MDEEQRAAERMLVLPYGAGKGYTVQTLNLLIIRLRPTLPNKLLKIFSPHKVRFTGPISR